MKKKYRFFFHYNRLNNGMSVHYRGKCHQTTHVRCQVYCETRYNKRQPHLVMQGFAQDITEHFEYSKSIITIL